MEVPVFVLTLGGQGETLDVIVYCSDFSLETGSLTDLTFTYELAGKPLPPFLCPPPPTIESASFELRFSHSHSQCSHPRRHVPSSTTQHGKACKRYKGKGLYLTKSTIKKTETVSGKAKY